MKITLKFFLKTILIGTVSIILLFCCFLLFLSSLRNVILLSWNILLPKPTSVEEIYSVDLFQDGYDFYVFHYSSAKTDKIYKNKKFKKMDVKVVKELLDKHRSYIDDDCKKIYDDFGVNDLVSENNYYYYKEKNANNHYAIFILNPDKKELYYLLSY